MESQEVEGDFSFDPVKVEALIAEREAEALTLDRVVESLEGLAKSMRRGATRLRLQNAALLRTAKRHGYTSPS